MKAKTTASNSFSIWAYLVSASVRALEAKATGLSSCRIAAPRPDCKASHEMVTGFVTSKYARAGCWDKISLTLRNALFWDSAHSKNDVRFQQLSDWFGYG